MRRTACAVFAAAILFLLLGNYRPALAQVLYGSITGTIQDPSGAAVPGTDVTIINQGTTQETSVKSDSQGRYSLLNLLPGTYNLKAAASGFRTTEQTGILISPNVVGRIDLKLEVGNMTEQVTVSAQTAQLQTDKADTHTEITTKAITNMPLPAYRNYQSLINLVPGATPAAFQNSVTDTPNRSLATHINGTNDQNNVTRIDGASSVNLWLPHHTGYVMPAEMVDNVNVTTSAGDAQQGFAGGAAITVVTKSGTNEFHGSAFEFHDDQHLKARNYFQAAGVDKPLSIYNNYGGTVGGPVLKNKLFFFFSYDATRQRQGSSGRYSVPTLDQRAGDFSALKTTIYDPLTGNADGTGRTAFAGNVIPGNRISPQAAKLQSFYPNPNLPGTSSNYFAQAVPIFNRNYADVKLNYNRGEKETFWGHYGKNWDTVSGEPIFGVAGGPAPGADPATSDTKIHIASMGHTYAFSPTFLMDNVFGYQRQDQSVLPTQSYGTNYGEQLGIPGLNGDEIRQSGFPNFDISGLTSLGYAGWIPAFRTEENFTMSHNFTWVKSAHEIRFGFDGVLYRMSHYQPELGAGPRGEVNFTGGLTALKGGASSNQYNAYAAFLLGMPHEMQKSLQYILMTPREWHFGFYGQDRWQVTPKLTLSYGLRYEYYPLMTRAHQKGIERLDPATNLVYLGGRGDVPNSVGVTTSKLLFAPRFGFAYRLNEKTVVRSGYGINYDPLPLSRPLRGFYPLTVNFDFPGANGFTQALDSSGLPLNLATGMPPVTGPDLSTGIVPLPAAASERTPYSGELHRGYTQSWNLTVERRLPSNVLFSMAYVGTQTVHQFADLDINAGYPGSGTAGLPYAKLFGRTQPTNMWDGYLSSHYHSLQTSVRRQFSNGLMIQGAYTWSKAINMTDDDGWASVGWNWAPVFDRNRAPAGYDRTHVFQIGWVYDLPFGKGKPYANSGLLSHIVGDWEVDGVMSAYTGTPFNISAPSDSLNAPNNTQTADQVKSNVEKLGQAGPGGVWFDPTAFKTVTEQRFGSSGRNILRGPGVFNTDLTLARTFPIKERVNLQFRSEWYNMPNSVHLNNPNNDSSSPNFMRVLSSYNERQIRFGLRLNF
jgi:hypothetical protein